VLARVKPILKSMLLGQRTDERVAELKPGARAVVTALVVTVIPVLLYLFAMLAVNAPSMYAAAWDSLLVHYTKVWAAFGDGKVIDGVAGLL
jgi:hypothetical protein